MHPVELAAFRVRGAHKHLQAAFFDALGLKPAFSRGSSHRQKKGVYRRAGPSRPIGAFKDK
jgi:hypothetical protein